jgi:hypothetical protein
MILPLVLSSHEEATVRCAKARPGSNSSTGSKAPVRLTTSGPHVVAKLSKLDPVFIDRCVAKGRHAELIPSGKRGTRRCEFVETSQKSACVPVQLCLKC